LSRLFRSARRGGSTNPNRYPRHSPFQVVATGCADRRPGHGVTLPPAGHQPAGFVRAASGRRNQRRRRARLPPLGTRGLPDWPNGGRSVLRRRWRARPIPRGQVPTQAADRFGSHRENLNRWLAMMTLKRPNQRERGNNGACGAVLVPVRLRRTNARWGRIDPTSPALLDMHGSDQNLTLRPASKLWNVAPLGWNTPNGSPAKVSGPASKKR